MKELIIKIQEKHYALLLQFLQTLSYVEVEPVAKSSKNAPERTYDFSDLQGKLQWTGDAVAEQRRLRDEW